MKTKTIFTIMALVLCLGSLTTPNRAQGLPLGAGVASTTDRSGKWLTTIQPLRSVEAQALEQAVKTFPSLVEFSELLGLSGEPIVTPRDEAERYLEQLMRARRALQIIELDYRFTRNQTLVNIAGAASDALSVAIDRVLGNQMDALSEDIDRALGN